KLGQWETSTSGRASIHTLFEVHKQEILSLLALLPPLISSFGRIYMTVAPALTQSFVTVLKAISPVLTALSKTPGGAWVIGLTLIGLKLGVLQAPLRALAAAIIGVSLAPLKAAVAWLLASSWGPAAAGIARVGAALKASTLSMLGFDAAADANPIGAIIIAVAALGAGLYLLVTHFKQVSDFLHGPWGTAISIAVAAVFPLIGISMLLIGHWQAVVSFFRQAWADIRQWSVDAWQAIDGGAIQPLARAAITVVQAFSRVPAFFSGMWATVKSVF